MTLGPGLRKFVLAAHVASSVGWLGACAVFLALGITGMTSLDAQLVRSADLAMELTAWFVIVPLCLASLLTGLVCSLGTSWGLFRHYWILVKLLITLFSTFVLLVHMQPISQLADNARNSTGTLSGSDLHGVRTLLVTATVLALLALLVLTALSVYKPKGITRYGWRKQRAASQL
jgi:hypothetical protein